MDEDCSKEPQELLGLILKGIVVAEYGNPINIRGKPSKRVVVNVEIAFDDGLATWTRFIDLVDCPHWLEADEFIDIPRIGLKEKIILKVHKAHMKNGIVEIQSADIIS